MGLNDVCPQMYSVHFTNNYCVGIVKLTIYSNRIDRRRDESCLAIESYPYCC